jgi:hypothetical protein
MILVVLLVVWQLTFGVMGKLLKGPESTCVGGESGTYAWERCAALLTVRARVGAGQTPNANDHQLPAFNLDLRSCVV